MLLVEPGQPADSDRRQRIGKAERDFIALGITTIGIILFVGTGGAVLANVLRSATGLGMGPDRLAVNALLLNIALIIFSWRRYRQLSDEVRERRRAEEQAHILAHTDPLTGCLNRRSISAATDQLIIAAHARGDNVAFFMIDLDNFKRINDVYGHGAGDRTLQECASRITGLLPEDALIARLGGDEFACVIPFAANHPDRIDRLADAIISAAARPVVMEGTNFDVTVSLGISRSEALNSGGSPAVDAMMLLHNADIAMYHAKKQGRNRYFWFESPMESELRFRSELETGIRRGIIAGEFVPNYEQQIDLTSGKLTGFEMLARWKSPTLGMINPEVFITVAEEIGVIGELSENLIAQALRDARDWDPSLTLSVNISPLQLRDPWFAQKLLKLLVEARFQPARLEIEITESCLHENIAAARTLITSLKNQGVRISLDDFGTGYSSLAQLRSLPFDQIKIDRSFVMTMHENNDSATIVATIAALGHGLGLPITAEGIECVAVLDQLRQYGKLKGQGYLYGRPESGEATRKRLSEMNLMAVANVEAPQYEAAASREATG